MESLIKIINVWLIVSVLIIIYSSWYRGDFLSSKSENESKFWIYFVCASAFIGLVILFRKGFDGIMPEQFGHITEDGDWIPYGDTLSVILSGMLLDSLYRTERLRKKCLRLETKLEASVSTRGKYTAD